MRKARRAGVAVLALVMVPMLTGAGSVTGPAPMPTMAGIRGAVVRLVDWVTGRSTPKPALPRQLAGTAPGEQRQVPAAVTRAVARAEGRAPGKGPGQLPAYAVHAATVGRYVTGPASPGGAGSFSAASSRLVPSGATAASRLFRNADGSYTRLESPAAGSGTGAAPGTLRFSAPSPGVGVKGTHVTSASLRVLETWAGSCPASAAVTVSDAAGHRVGRWAGKPPASACGTGAAGGWISVPVSAAGLRALSSARGAQLTVSVTPAAASAPGGSSAASSPGQPAPATPSATASVTSPASPPATASASPAAAAAASSSSGSRAVLMVTAAVDTPPQVDDQWPANGYNSPSLTPELIATGSDPDGDTVTYDFRVYKPDGTMAADSGWGAGDFVVPAGALAWGQTYFWTVQAADGTLYSQDLPIFALQTPVPQPLVDSNFAQDGSGPGSGSPASGPGFDPQNGNFTTQATDVSVAVTGPPLSLQRTYNSLSPLTSGAFGTGWSSVLDMTVRPGPPGAGGSAATEIVTYPDGEQVAYGKNADGTTYTPPQGRFGTLLPMTGGWELVDKNDAIYQFTRSLGSGAFAISELNDAIGHALHLSYNSAGQVTQMSSAASKDRYLNLTWSTPAGAQDPHVATVSTDPVTPGNQASAITWQYSYSGDQLTAACNESQAGQPCTAYTYQTGSDFPAAVLNSGPQSYWRLNDASGTTAVSSVLANEGTDNATYAGVVQHTEPGPLEGEPASVKAAGFDGSDSVVQVPASLGDEAAAMSVKVSFKTAAAGGVLFSESADPLSDVTTTNPYQPVLYIGSDGDVEGGFHGTGAPLSSGFPVNDGTWNTVVLTSDGSQEVMYIDGDQVASKAAQASAFPQPHIYLGAGFLGGANPDEPHAGQAPAASYFSGEMSDAATWARPLTAAEVAALHQAGDSDAALLTAITRPSLKTFEQASYDPATSWVTHVTDASGGSWTVPAPAVTGSSQVYVAAVQGARPKDYWRLADTGTSTAVSQFTGGTATYSNVTQGVTGGPFADTTVDAFNGTSSYLALPNGLIGSGNQSVSLWFKTTATDAILLSSSADSIASATTASPFTPNLYIGDDGDLNGEFSYGDVPIESAGQPVNDGKWHNVVLAAQSGEQDLYLDGTHLGSVTAPIGGGSSDGENNVYVGAGFFGNRWADPPNYNQADPNGSRTFFTGDIAEVAVYSHQLLAADVAAEYAAALHSPGLTPVEAATATDPGGHPLRWTYDPGNSARILSRTDGLGNTTTYGYDTGGFQSRVTDPDGHVTDTGLDVRGNMTSQTTCQDQAAGKCSTSFYSFSPDDTRATLTTPFSANDEVMTSSDGRSSSQSDTTFRTTNVYNLTGELQTTTTPPVPGFPSGRITHYAYTDGVSTAGSSDGSIPPGGLLYQTTSPGQAVTQTLYTADGDIGETINADNLTTTFTYDGIGRKTSQTVDPSGLDLVTTYSYDANGRVTQQTDPMVTDQVTGAQHTPQVTTIYDADGDVLSQKTADTTGGDASRTVSNTYNAHDQKDFSTDAAGAVTHYSYDAYGNKASQTDPAGNETDYAYDPNGHLLTTTLANYSGGLTGAGGATIPAGRLTEESRAYDPAGRLASVTDAMGRVTSYAYTDNGLTATITRSGPGGGSFKQESDSYDAAGNLVSKVTSNGATTTNYSVDAAGRVASQTVDPGGLDRVTSYTYDPDDHIATQAVSQGSGSPLQSISYTYDPMGNKTSQTVTDPGAGGPAGWWQLGQSSGATAADASGTGNLATASGGVTWSGSRSNGVALDGQDGSRIATRGPVVDTTGSFTVSAWVNLAANTGQGETAVSQDAGALSGFYLGFSPDTGTWRFSRPQQDANDASLLSADSGVSPQFGTWTFLTGVFDANTGDMRVYVNGAYTGGDASDPSPVAAHGPLEIGASEWDGQAGTSGFDGSISDVQVYPTALTASEIGSLYGQGRAGGDLTRDGLVTTWNRDQRGLPTSQTSPDRRTTYFSYDEAGRLAVTTGPKMLAEYATDPSFVQPTMTATGYDTFGDATATQDSYSNTTAYTFDPDGRPVSRTLPEYIPDGGTTAVNGTSAKVYNSLGQVTAATDADGNTTHYSYDQLGNRTTQTDPDGGVTTAVYDADGEQLSLTGPTGAQTTATWDNLGRQLTATDVERSPPAAYTTTASYAPTAVDPSGTWESSAASPDGVVTKYGYDAAGETTQVTDGAGNTTGASFDALGRQTATTNPDGTSQTVAYDPAGNQVAQASLDASGHTLATATAGYDGEGDKVATTDALGHATTFTYNPSGDLTAETQPVTDSSGIVTSFGYDADGNQTRYTDGNGNVWGTAYTTRNQIQWKVEPPTSQYPESDTNDREARTIYDGNGNPVSVSDFGNASMTYSYDSMGNLAGQSGSGATAPTPTRSFTYDQAGRMLTAATTATATASATSEAFTWNDRGLPLTATGSAGSTTYTWNGDGQQASVQDAAGKTSYGYDNAGRLQTLADPASGATLTYSYNTMSQLSQISFGASADTRAYGYDNLHRLTSDTLSHGSTTLASIGYGYDLNDDLTSKATTGPAGFAGTNSYGYDQAGRLTSWTSGSATTTYAYDGAGNRVKAGNTTYTYDARDQLTSDGTSSYSYTANGDLSSVTGPSGTVTSTSDAYGEQSTSGPQSSTYDANDRVVGVKASGGPVTPLSYVGSSGQLASDGTASYTWTPDGTLTGTANSPGSGVLDLTDQHTDVVAQFTANGTAMTGSRTFGPWGSVTAAAGILTGSLGYQSQYTSPATGQTDMGSRWYNPATGSFGNKDTVANKPVPDSASASPFGYAADNPLTGTDPTGHMLVPEPGVSTTTTSIANLVAASLRNGAAAATTSAAPSAATAHAPTESIGTWGDFFGGYFSNAASMGDLAVLAFPACIPAEVLCTGAEAAGISPSGAYQKLMGALGINTNSDRYTSGNLAGMITSLLLPDGAGEENIGLRIAEDSLKPLEDELGTLVTSDIAKALSGGGRDASKVADSGISSASGDVAKALDGDIFKNIGNDLRLKDGDVAPPVKDPVRPSGETPKLGEPDASVPANGETAPPGEGNPVVPAARNTPRFSDVPPCGGGMSFTASTQVLLASGATAAISSLKPGDKVLATNTKTGKTSPEAVTAVEVNHDHDLYDLKVKTSHGVTVIHTTASHLFWDPVKRKWVKAAQLAKGEHLKTADGQVATADGGTTPTHHDGPMWDLTVPGDNDHDFYVITATVGILVHNDSCSVVGKLAYDRATALHAMLHDGSADGGRAFKGLTTGVTYATDNTGEVRTIVTSSDEMIPDQVRAAMRPGEIPVDGPGHAEDTALDYINEQGWTPLGGATNRNTCAWCQNRIQGAGMSLQGPSFLGYVPVMVNNALSRFQFWGQRWWGF